MTPERQPKKRLVRNAWAAPGDDRDASSGRSPGLPPAFLLDAESLVLVLDGLAEVLEPPRMGLVAGDGTLLDGLYQPARIEPGTNGALSVVLPGPPDSADSVAGPGSLRGWITLVGPWASPPSVPFEATSRSD